MSDRILDIGGIGKQLDRVSAEVLPAVHRRIATAFGAWAHGKAVRNYPVGHAGSKKQRQTSPHPGKARASNAVSAGAPEYADLPDRPTYPVPGEADAEAGVAGLRFADEVWVSNDAKNSRSGYNYPQVLEGGRREVNGRSVGSEQAPDGIYKPIQEEAPDELDRIVDDAFRDLSKVKP